MNGKKWLHSPWVPLFDVESEEVTGNGKNNSPFVLSVSDETERGTENFSHEINTRPRSCGLSDKTALH